MNPARKYYIFRHGETFVTRGTRLNYGLKVFSAEILEEGKPALRRMGDYIKKLKTDYNVSSQVKRCRQTVSIISERSGKEFSFDSRLNEFFLELPIFFRKRVKSFLRDLEQRNYRSVLICTHAAVINELIRAINPAAFPKLISEDSEARPPVQTEASRKSIPNQVEFTKYLSPAVLLELTENSVKEVNFNEVHSANAPVPKTL